MTPDRPRRSHRRRLLTRLVLLAFVAGLVGAGYVGIRGLLHNLGGPQCQATALGQSVTFDPEQTANAATITAIADRRGLPPRAATIAIATSLQESKLRNITYGDRDSLGLFQQRPSQGWGTEQQILDPAYATNRFYDALVKIEGYEAMEITAVAQKVQRSAFPEAYAEHEQEGRILASTLSGHSPAGLGCRLKDAGTSNPAGLTAALKSELAVTGTPSGKTLRVQGTSDLQAWGVGAWAVAKADSMGVTSVRVGNRTWTRTFDNDGWTWATSKAAGSRQVVITFG